MVYIGADHRGFEQKEKLREWLRGIGAEVEDVGVDRYDKDDDYPMIAFKLAEKVGMENEKGILICGSGVGVVVAANKVRRIRAGLCTSVKQVMAARNDDNINVLCLSADLVSLEDNQEIAKAFLETPFGSEEKFIRRINMITHYEFEVN